MMERKKINILNEEIFYLEQNNHKEQTILFVHGFLSSSDFAASLFLLKKEYNILALDLPSNGRSTSNEIPTIAKYQETVNAFIDKMTQYKNFTVLGHSLGGISAAFAANNNSKVNKLVLLSSANPFMIKNDSTRKLILRLIQPKSNQEAVESVESLVFNQNKESWFKNVSATARSLMNLVKASKTKFRFMVENEILNKEFLEKEVLNLFLRVKKPTIIVHGDKDHFVSLESAQKLSEEMEKKIIVIYECGHAPIYEYPVKLNNILQDFISDKKLDHYNFDVSKNKGIFKTKILPKIKNLRKKS